MGRIVIDLLRLHRADHTEPVGLPGQMRKEIADLDPSLAMLLKADE